MRRENLYHFLEVSSARDLIVTFTDGDTYHGSDLDLCASLDGDDQPIVVYFAHTQGQSQALKHAQTTRPGQSPGIIWTSQPPIEPIGMRYTVEHIESVFDAEQNFCVYAREP